MKIIGTRASKEIDGLIRIPDDAAPDSGFVTKMHNRRVALFWSPGGECWRIVTKMLPPHGRISISELNLREDTMHELVGLYVAHAQLAGQANGLAWADVPALHAEIERRDLALQRIEALLADPLHRTEAEQRAYVIARAARSIGGRG